MHMCMFNVNRRSEQEGLVVESVHGVDVGQCGEHLILSQTQASDSLSLGCEYAINGPGRRQTSTSTMQIERCSYAAQ